LSFSRNNRVAKKNLGKQLPFCYLRKTLQRNLVRILYNCKVTLKIRAFVIAWIALLAYFMGVIYGTYRPVHRYTILKRFILADFFLQITYTLLIYSAYLNNAIVHSCVNIKHDHWHVIHAQKFDSMYCNCHYYLFEYVQIVYHKNNHLD
jgi:hypothetical protein